MIQIFLNGLNYFSSNLIASGSFLFVAWLWGAWLVYRLFKIEARVGYFYLICTGVISISMVSWTGYLLQTLFPVFLFSKLLIYLLNIGILIDLSFLIKKQGLLRLLRVELKWSYFLMFVPILAFVCLRLSMGEQLYFPSYSDSPEHFLINQNILNPAYNIKPLASMEKIFNRYYHFGFHSFAAFFSVVLDMEIINGMIFLPVILSALAPFPIYAYLKSNSLDRNSALFGAVLAGVGWVMPYYSLNWGKFPAMMAVVFLPIALVALDKYFALKMKSDLKLALFFTAGLALIHTRMIIIVAVYTGLHFLEQSLKDRWKIFISAVFYCVVILFLSFRPVEYDRYITISTLLTLLVFPLSIKYNRSLAFKFTGFAALALLVSILPIPIDITKYAAANLLDRPFIELILYIPFAIIGAVGFEGIVSRMRNFRWKLVIQFALLSIVIVLGLNPKNFEPNLITVYVKPEDGELIAWINEYMETGSIVHIPAAVYPNKLTGLDAGIWITPMTGVLTEKTRFSDDLSLEEEFSSLCAGDGLEKYVYSGTGSYSFVIQDFADPELFQLAVSKGDAELYKINCE